MGRRHCGSPKRPARWCAVAGPAAPVRSYDSHTPSLGAASAQARAQRASAPQPKSPCSVRELRPGDHVHMRMRAANVTGACLGIGAAVGCGAAGAAAAGGPRVGGGDICSKSSINMQQNIDVFMHRVWAHRSAQRAGGRQWWLPRAGAPARAANVAARVPVARRRKWLNSQPCPAHAHT